MKCRTPGKRKRCGQSAWVQATVSRGLVCTGSPLHGSWLREGVRHSQARTWGLGCIRGKEGMSGDIPRIEVTKLGDSLDVGDKRKQQSYVL